MYKYILVMALLIPGLVFGGSKEDLQPKIELYATKFNVSIQTMNTIVADESGYVGNALGDMHITCKRTGRPVRARGLVQITQCYWPNVSDEEANDPDFALNFLAYWLSKGKCSWWMTCPVNA